MPSSDLVALAILPAVIWASFAYAALSTGKTASKLRAAWSAKTKQELIEGAQSWALYALLAFLIVLAGVVVWTRIQRSNAPAMILNPSHWERGIFHGVMFGLSLLGMLLILRRHFPEARKFSLLVMAGIASPPWVAASTLLIVVFTEELWRAVCLTALMGDGVSGQSALVVTSIAYGLTFLAWGTPIAISEGIVGAALGGLFLWSDSLYVPFAAHVTFLGQALLYAIAAGPDARPGDIHRRPFTKCPACGATLSIRQVNLNINEAFFCPFCRARVTSSDRRRGFLRWGFIFVFMVLLLASFDIFPGAARGSKLQYWLSIAFTCCAGPGLWSILQVVLPPKLECGDPDFVSLNLGDRQAVGQHEEKPEESSNGDSK